MVIDGGSGGSRLHVFRWEPRIFKQIPPAITVPTSDEKWTQRIGPGIADLSGSKDLIQDHLIKLLNFAKNTLVGLESDFSTYPIFFKATGGMREMPVSAREVVMSQVRHVLSNKTICPFYFTNDMARVISGEEEAIYSWAAVNFLLGNLIPQSIGSGTAAATQSNSTYGTIDLGGASSQIAFFVPSQVCNQHLKSSDTISSNNDYFDFVFCTGRFRRSLQIAVRWTEALERVYQILFAVWSCFCAIATCDRYR